MQSLHQSLSQLQFQSSPAPKGGRYQLLLIFAHSILRFNPRPPRRAGATTLQTAKELAMVVSILARPEGRALPGQTALFLWINTFQSSPAPKGGRYRFILRLCGGIYWFQSSPAPKGGRYHKDNE